MSTPRLDLDFTTGTLPPLASLTRSGARARFGSDGKLSSVANNIAAYEWNELLAALGLSVEPAATNLLLQANHFDNGSWAKFGPTISAGQAGPDGTTSAFKVVEFNGAAQNIVFQQTTVVAGEYTEYVIVKPGERTNLSIDVSDNAGSGLQPMYRLTGKGWYLLSSFGSNFSGASGGCLKVGNLGWYLCWVTATVANPTWQTRIKILNSVFADNYTGDGASGFYLYGAQLQAGPRPTSFIATTTASAAVAADALQVTDLSWFSAGQGTFVVEQDALSGVVLKSGANDVLTLPSSPYARRATRKTAIAWGGGSASRVDDGGAAAIVAVPTFGADFSLPARGHHHYRRVTFYDTKLSAAEMQSITALPAESGGTLGAWRGVAARNKLHNNTQSLTSQRSFFTRYKYVIGSGAVSKLKLSFTNWYLNGSAEQNTGNAVLIDQVALERGGAFAPVTFGGNRAITLASGDNDIQSDEVLASALGVTSLARGDVVWVRIKGHVATSGHLVPGARVDSIISGAQSRVYDPASTTVSEVDATGDFTSSGSPSGTFIFGFSAILVGKFTSGDPKTYIGVGDSIMNCNGEANGFVSRAVFDADEASNPFAFIEVAVGGAQATHYTGANTKWRGYLSYARVVVDGLGANTIGGDYQKYIDFWELLRTTTIEKIVKTKITPRTTSSNQFANEANQSYAFGGAGGSLDIQNQFLNTQYKDRQLEAWAPLTSVEGVDPFKWKANGTAFYATSDGTHPTDTGQDFMSDDLRPILAAVSVPTPLVPETFQSTSRHSVIALGVGRRIGASTAATPGRGLGTGGAT